MAVNLDACIQCNLCVRACREVQVNDVIGMAGRGYGKKDHLRLRRPDGGIDLRRLRRMRAGLPDRCADAGDSSSIANVRTPIPGPRGRQRVPLLRGGLPNHLSHPDDRIVCVTAETGRPTKPALRQGPVRLRLHAHPASADAAADPQGRRSKHDNDTVDPANP